MSREATLLLLGLSIYKAIRFISHSLNGNQPVAVDDSSQDDVILTQTVSPPATQYDVFLSFRGEDTRYKFASHLYKGLHDVGIHTFMDHELIKGEQISEVLLRKIEESEISVIIFSENYASSTWCMDELVHILKCKKKIGRDVIPIFYNVDPSNIRKQNGSFGKGFNVLKRRFKDNPKKLQRWRDALIQSTSLSGWDSNSTRPEFKLIEEIVKDILSKLNYNSSYHLEGLVGIARHIRKIENLLTEARIVGIWGMGGAGKTTLAKAIFQVLRAQFDAFSFIEDVKKQLKSISLDELQQNCLKELLKDKDISIYDIKSTFVKKRLGRKKILLILDDVDNAMIVEGLTNVLSWCGEGSRIIITSRDIRVLQNAYAKTKPRSTQATYHVSDLDFHDAIHLFSLKAFKQDEPYEGYMELSKSVVEYCQGNPLALVVLGCFLCGREKEEWKSFLKKLDKDPPKDVIDVLKFSFDGLDGKQQNVFLDLAFLINEKVHISLNLRRQLYDSSGPIEISVLREKSLISLDHHGCVVMHDLVMKMGLEIARQQLLFANPGTLVRLWKYEDIDYFFSCGKEMEAIRCMSLDMSKIQKITLRASSFRKMHNLIFFKIYKSDRSKPSMLNIRGVLDYLPKELRFLSWEECPLPYVRLHFCADNLITLDMPNSNIRQFLDGNQRFPNLEKIDLAHSEHLTALLDLSHAPNIQELDVLGCVNLSQIHSSTFPGDDVNLKIDDCGPMQIKVGGSIKGRSSGSMIVSSVFDLKKLSLNKITMKVFVCGNMICGVRLKHDVMLLEEKEELRKGTQSLGSLLPFVRKVKCLEGPIEFGHDFNQHFIYGTDYSDFSDDEKEEMSSMEDDEEDNVLMEDDKEDNVLMEYCCSKGVGEHQDDEDDFISDVDKEERGDRGEMMNKHQVVMLSLMEDDEGDDVLMEDCCNKSVTFTRVPNSITRWSLLKELTLKSLPLSHEYCRRIKPRLDVTYSFPNIIPSSASSEILLIINYDLDSIQRRGVTFPHFVHFNCVLSSRSPDSIYDTLMVWYRDCSEPINDLKELIERKRG